MQQALVFLILAFALGMFAWGRLRHDIVALLSLFAVVVAGIIPGDEAFVGFAHPAVITVASVLIIGRALEVSGLVDVLGEAVSKTGSTMQRQLLAMCLLVAVASAFMNNVGAIAIMMPVALSVARKNGYPPSAMLMPLAFSSLLGGFTTLIGTPPNIIIATLRAESVGSSFNMFDFTPVGTVLAVVGVVFVASVGWRLIPHRKPEASERDLFRIDEYITEVHVTKDSCIKGMTVGEVCEAMCTDVNLLGMVRQNKRIHAPDRSETFKTRDIVILEADAEDLKAFLDKSGTVLVGEKKFRKDAKGSKDIDIVEVVVMDTSPLIGQTASGLSMRSRYGINLLAFARREKKTRKRLDHIPFKSGDVLLLQGRSHMMGDVVRTLDCLPLARRGLVIGYQRRIALALGIFGASIIAVVGGFLPVHISFSLAAVAMVVAGLLPLKEVYTTINWPVIVLLGAMLPVGTALETSGGSGLIADYMIQMGTTVPVWALLALVMVTTMFLSDIINNAATVVLMAPIAMEVATGIGGSVDPFLMAVAIGGSSSFLTPIGHQSNTLVMGPGGYRFTDYWRVGLPLEILIVVIGVPLILAVWPL
ncbi:MAG: SLC13 family permease [Candidatus Methanofastidiosa archaeon]|nr:SLC13 family permease [Candidatus Methanofastidiosa archaeon]